MKNAIDYIYQRRSIRKFNKKSVESEKINLLIKAAMAAPSACNQQPWEFIVVSDKEVLNDLKSSLYSGNYNAPLAIVVCGNMKLALSGPGKDYWIQDCSAAAENMLIAATDLNLGSVWIGVHPIASIIKPVKKILNIPEYVVPLGVIYIGYPEEEKKARTQYNKKRVYKNKYDPDRKHRARKKNLKYT
ncbi:MAG: nitroreductase family protein [Firmicutes bacterium]|nr:nitroreductase family protein [Bacillota bacterium]